MMIGMTVSDHTVMITLPFTMSRYYTGFINVAHGLHFFYTFMMTFKSFIVSSQFSLKPLLIHTCTHVKLINAPLEFCFRGDVRRWIQEKYVLMCERKGVMLFL